MKDKILVTGGAGFIGSHIVDFFIKKGHQVVVVDNLSRGKEKNLNPKAKFYKLDILSPKLSKIFQTEKPQIIIHEAAQINVRDSILDPTNDAQINILGAINLFQIATKFKVKKIIYASSGGAVYGEPESLPVDEEHRIKPLCPYGLSKYSVELYLKYFADLANVPYVILRYANVYGPRQDPKGEAGVIAIFIDKFMNNLSPIIFGDGQQTRDFIYVADVARANYLAYKKGKNNIFNIGLGKRVSILDIYELEKKIFNKNIKAEFSDPIAGEVKHIVLDINKAEQKLNFKAKISFEDGLEKTIDWAKTIYE